MIRSSIAGSRSLKVKAAKESGSEVLMIGGGDWGGFRLTGLYTMRTGDL
jgi:hypothetical protein